MLDKGDCGRFLHIRPQLLCRTRRQWVQARLKALSASCFLRADTAPDALSIDCSQVGQARSKEVPGTMKISCPYVSRFSSHILLYS